MQRCDEQAPWARAPAAAWILFWCTEQCRPAVLVFPIFINPKKRKAVEHYRRQRKVQFCRIELLCHRSSEKGDLPLGHLIPVWDAGWSSLTLSSFAYYKNMSKNQIIAADDVRQEETVLEKMYF